MPFLVRGLASIADVMTALVVFELVRLHRSVGQAVAAGVLISISPALLVISGFHGNTDPVFVMFTLLSAYFVTRERDFAAGVAIALAISLKLVPVVVVPVLAVWLLRSGWRRLGVFAGGGLTVFVLLWVPVVLTGWTEFREDVLAYDGVVWRTWGLPQFLTWASAPEGWIEALAGPGRFVVLVVCSAVPALVVWRRPTSFVPAVGLSLVLFLLLSPAWGMQYLSWALAAAYLVGTIPATAFNLVASIFVLNVYSSWSGGGPPWHWYEAVADFPDSWDLRLMVLSWLALAWVAIAGLRTMLQTDEEPADDRREPRAAVEV